MTAVLILVAGSDRRQARLIRGSLAPLGYQIEWVGIGEEMVEAVERYSPDLVIIDPGVADDALRQLRQLRQVSDVPVIVIGFRGETVDKVRALDQGADDYMAKPLDLGELIARVRALLRRTGQLGAAEKPAVLECGELVIDFAQRSVVLNGREVDLTNTEFKVLECLARRKGHLVVADDLLRWVWGPAYCGEYNLLYIFISRLRRKLGESARQPRFIFSRPGIGYVLRYPTERR